MTSASELFYTRRSRYNRSTTAAASVSDLGLGFPSPSPDRNVHSSFYRRHAYSHGHGHGHSRRQDLDGCDPLRRSPHLRAQLCHRFLQPDSGPSWFDQGPSRPVSRRSLNAEHHGNIRSGSSAHNRLPGSVLLARERLLERLRGVSISGNRRSIRNSPGIGHGRHEFDDHWRLADVGDWGTDALMHSSDDYLDFLYVTSTSERTVATCIKKPPGLSQDVVDSLPQETFCLMDDIDGATKRASQECSICLETYINDDKLTCLPCEHRFHSACLDPWIRTCGDCPCCRKGIIMGSDQTNWE